MSDLSGDFNDDGNQFNKGVPESASYGEYHYTAETHSAPETTSYSETGDVFARAKPVKTLTTSRGMNEALKYSTQVATVIKAVTVITVAAVVVGVPLLDIGTAMEFDWFELKAEDTLVHYYVEVADYDENMDLTITVHNYFFSQTMEFDGSYASGTVTGLQPNMQYRATIKNAGVTVGEKSFWTLSEPTTHGPTLELTGVHLEGTDRDKLYIDMDYDDPSRLFSVKSMNVYVNESLYGTDCTVYDMGGKPYVLLDRGKEIESKSDTIRLVMSYSKLSEETGEEVMQDDMVKDGLHVAYVAPRFTSVGGFERMGGMSPTPVESKMTFKFYTDDPDSNWSDYSVSAYYRTPGSDVHNPIEITDSHFMVESDGGIFCASMLPTSVPEYNAAIYVTLSCSEKTADGSTATATLFEDEAVPTVFVTFTDLDDGVPYSNGKKINFTVTEYVGVDSGETFYAMITYVPLTSEGTENTSASYEYYPYAPNDKYSPGSKTFTGPAPMTVEFTDVDTASTFGYGGHGYLSIWTDSNTLISAAYIEGFSIMTG